MVDFPGAAAAGGGDSVPKTSFAVPSYMVGASYFNIQSVDIAATPSEQPGATSVFIPYRVYEDHDFDAFSTQFNAGILDTEFGLYNYDVTGLKLGAKLAGATSGATPTLNVLTDLTFGGTVNLPAGWYWLGFSGVGANATTLYASETAGSVNADSGYLGFGINATPGAITFFYQSAPFYTAAARIAAISPGDALTTAVIDFSTPFIGLRAA